MSEQMENHSRETETIEKNQVEILELKGLSKILNLPDALNNWLETATKKVSKIKDGPVGIIQSEEQSGENDFLLNEGGFSDRWDDTKQSSICIIIVPEEKQWGKYMCMYLH